MAADQHHLTPNHTLWMRASVIVCVAVLALITGAMPALASINSGEQIFHQHCSGCHVNGGNIIRRSRTLKLAALQRHGVEGPDAIAAIAREGIGQMSSYGDVLGDGDDVLVAEWIWQQAQNAWTQG